LNLSYSKLIALPVEIKRLTKLKELDLHCTPYLDEELAIELANLRKGLHIRLSNSD